MTNLWDAIHAGGIIPKVLNLQVISASVKQKKLNVNNCVRLAGERGLETQITFRGVIVPF